MAIADDLPQLERMLNELITKYEQYFIGLEKREPLPLLAEFEKIVRRYANTHINNTMFKHKYTMLVARFSTYREHWNRTTRQIEEGKYSRNRFIGEFHRRQVDSIQQFQKEITAPHYENKLDSVYHEFRNACKLCNLPVDKINRDQIEAMIEKKIPNMAERLGNGDLLLKVVIEGGKPKIKASQNKLE